MLPPGAVVADAAALLAAPLPLSLSLLLRLASLVAFLCARPRGLDAERLGDGVPALRHDDIREAPPSNRIESAGRLLRLEVHESRERKRFVPLADTTGRNLGLEITTQRNPRCQRLAPRNSNPPPIFARNDLR